MISRKREREKGREKEDDEHTYWQTQLDRQLQIPKADRQAKRQPYYTHGRKRQGAAGSKRVASAFGD